MKFSAIREKGEKSLRAATTPASRASNVAPELSMVRTVCGSQWFLAFNATNGSMKQSACVNGSKN